MNTNASLLTDFYKIGHPFQYPKHTTLVYSNGTPRKSRIPGVEKMVWFGLQYFVKEYLIDYFNKNFFNVPKKTVIEDYKRRIRNSLGGDLSSYKHIEELHDLGYLPIRIKSLPEGSKVPMKVPCFTIVNTLPDFYWITNFLETILCASVWQMSTSATIANHYREILENYAKQTGGDKAFVQWQGHDFSFRGMSSFESAILSGMGHLLSFTGTDTIPAIDALEQYYNADSNNELIGGSVPATEHSVMCSGEKDSELETFKRLITEVYPSGIVSIVSDTWNLWKVCTEYLHQLKDIILARDGKVVIRPDSGDPADIICGLNSSGKCIFPSGDSGDEPVYQTSKCSEDIKGVVELLWDVFGGTINEQGYKVLDPHIGAIYGDSITPEVCIDICKRLKAKGFVSTNIVFGIGSFTYQHNTRDTFGFAMKATYIELHVGDLESLPPIPIIEGREIFKDPITDDGTKKSARGLLRVIKDKTENFILEDRLNWEQENTGELITVFENGKLLINQTLSEIRERIRK